MKFGSVCSGIEAGSVAWSSLGWEACWFAEIDAFPSAVLKHHYPNVPNFGDMQKIEEKIRSQEIEAPDLFCGGTPCQSFSLAGLRKSLDDERGNLCLTFCEIADAIDDIRAIQGKRPSIVLWENVPGVLSSRDNAFGHFLGRLVGSESKRNSKQWRLKMIEAFNAFMDTFLDLGRLGGVAVILGWLLVHPKDKLVWLLVIGFLVMGLASGYVAFQTA